MERIRELLDEMKSEFPGFVAGALVERDEGLTVAESKQSPDFDIQITAAYAVELMRSQERSLSALGMEDTLSDVLGISHDYYFFTRPVADSNFYLHIVVNRKKGSLGVLFAYVGKYQSSLEEAVTSWQAV